MNRKERRHIEQEQVEARNMTVFRDAQARRMNWYRTVIAEVADRIWRKKGQP